MVVRVVLERGFIGAFGGGPLAITLMHVAEGMLHHRLVRVDLSRPERRLLGPAVEERRPDGAAIDLMQIGGNDVVDQGQCRPGGGEVRLLLNGELQRGHRVPQRRSPLLEEGETPDKQLIRTRVVGASRLKNVRIDVERRRQGGANGAGDVLLSDEDVVHRLPKRVGPDHEAVVGPDQVGLDPERIANPADRAFDQILDVQRLADGSQVGQAALVLEGGRDARHAKRPGLRQDVEDLDGQTVGEAVVPAAVEILEGEHGEGRCRLRLRRLRWARRGRRTGRRRGGCVVT